MCYCDAPTCTEPAAFVAVYKTSLGEALSVAAYSVQHVDQVQRNPAYSKLNLNWQELPKPEKEESKP